MKTKFSRLLCAVFAAALVMSGCEKAPTGEYADQIRAARSITDKTDYAKINIVEFVEEYGDDKIPALVLKFDKEDKVDAVCGKIKEKFKGLDVPWLVTNYEDLVFEALADNEFKSLGIVIQNNKSEKTSLYDFDLPLERINNLKRVRIAELHAYLLKRIDRMDSVTELVTDGDLALLDLCPNLEKLTVPGLSDPSGILQIPTLKEVITDETPYGKATLYAFLRENPQINAKEPEKPTDKKELAQYDHAVQLYDVSRIDTSGYTEIPWDDVKLHGKIAVAGYGRAESASGFDEPEKYASAGLLSALAESPTERDVIIRVTSKSEVVGKYDNGKVGTDLTVYAEIIDVTNKTVTPRLKIDYSGPSGVITDKKEARPARSRFKKRGTRSTSFTGRYTKLIEKKDCRAVLFQLG